MKIAIVGAHRSTKLQAPYEDRDWQIWTCSPSNESELPRHDAWFEIHEMNDAIIAQRQGPVYREWLKAQPVVYMMELYPEYGGAVKYPLEEVESAFGRYFLTSSISFMMALAIMKKPEKIGLWGISDCPEYREQKSGILYFVQRAKECNIDIIAPEFLLKPEPLYGSTMWRERQTA